MSSKRNILLKSIGRLFVALWKLFLLGIYTMAKGIQFLASLTAKIADKLLNLKS